MSKIKQNHFFAVDVFGWAVADTWEKALKKRQRDSGTKKIYILVYDVPVPESAHYAIKNFMPVVDGITLVYQQPNATKKGL